MTTEFFGPYELGALIGRGGAGEVHRAYDVRRQRTVAIKRLRADLGANYSVRRRFLHDCEGAARLTEPHVLPIHEWGEIDGRLYVDMRYVPASKLDDALRASEPLPPVRAVDVVTQVASALDAAHAAGLVHGRITPTNVLLSSSAPGTHCYLADFGAPITPLDGYAAPEVVRGGAPDRRSDVYSLACLLRASLTGAAGGAQNVLPPELAAVIRRGTAEDPGARYASAGDLAAAADAALQGHALPTGIALAESAVLGSTTRSTGTGRPRPPFAVPALLASVVLLIALATVTGLTSFGSRGTVHLEPTDAIGSRAPFIPRNGTPGLAQQPVPVAATVLLGDAPGLYGGSHTDACHARGIAIHLDTHPDKSAAWAQAMGITPESIGSLLESLTPVTLRTDTAVTNHGFENGAPTPFQSVLQTGTAVLVDATGVPRVRCYCGNPLLPPARPAGARYEGPRWPGFAAEKVTVIKEAPAPVAEFVVVGANNEVLTRPRGSEGRRDHTADPAVADRTLKAPIGEGHGTPTPGPDTPPASEPQPPETGNAPESSLVSEPTAELSTAPTTGPTTEPPAVSPREPVITAPGAGPTSEPASQQLAPEPGPPSEPAPEIAIAPEPEREPEREAEPEPKPPSEPEEQPDEQPEPEEQPAPEPESEVDPDD